MSQSGFEFIKCKTIAAKSSCLVERFHKPTISNNRNDSNRLLLRTSQCEFGENFWSTWRMTLGEVPLLLRPHLAVTLFEILNCLSSPWASLLRAADAFWVMVPSEIFSSFRIRHRNALTEKAWEDRLSAAQTNRNNVEIRPAYLPYFSFSFFSFSDPYSHPHP